MYFPVNNQRRPRLNRQTISWLPTSTITHQRHSETRFIKEAVGSSSTKVELSGLREVLNKNLPLSTRLLWLAVFVVALIICFYQSAIIIKNLLDDPTLTTVRYKRNESIEFPAVVVCPTDLDDENNIVRYPVLNSALFKEHFANASADEVLNRLKLRTLTLSEVWDLYKLKIMDISVSTSDHSEELASSNSGSMEAVTISEVYTSFGTCVQICLKNNLKLYQGGTFSKLKLHGDFPFAMVALHQSDELPIEKYLYHRSGTIVKSTSLEKQYLRVTQVINRNTLKRPCGTSATVSNCLADCFVNKFTSKEIKLLCRLPFMSSFDDMKPCSSRTDVENMVSAIHNATEKFDAGICGCPRKCIQSMYVVESRHNIHDSTFGIEIYVSEVWITIMEEVSAYNEYKALSDLGGIIGLWLGMCLLELIELFTSCFSQLWLKIGRNKTESKNGNGIRFRVVEAGDLIVNKNPSTVSDYPGFNKVFKRDSSLFVRILWLTVFVTISGLCINQCAQQIKYYFSDPSATNIFYELNETIAFPSITICPKSKDGLFPAINPKSIEELLGRPQTNISVEQLIVNMSLTIDEIWNASRLYPSAMSIEDMQPDWYLHMVPTVIGNCHSFSPKHMSKYIGLKTKKILNMWGDYGEKLIIVHLVEDLPLITYLAHSYATESVEWNGWLSQRSFGITQLSYRNTWKSPCQDQRQVVLCLVKCLNSAIALKIGEGYCRLPYMDDDDVAVPVCGSEKEIYTMINVTLRVVDNFRQEDCLCIEICRKIVYSAEYVHEGIQMAPGLLTVELGVRDNRIMVVEESAAYTGFALFADIGGTLGLFIGLCILNLFEIIEAFYSKIGSFIRRVFWCPRKEDICFVRTVMIQELNSTSLTGGGYSGIITPGFERLKGKKSSSWARFVWFVVSSGTSILCTYQSVERIQHYLSDPTEIRSFYASNKSITFPLVLICPFQINSIFRLRDDEMHFLDYWDVSQLLGTYLSFSINEVDNVIKNYPFERIINESYHLVDYNINSNDALAITRKITSSGICVLTRMKAPLIYKGHRTSITFNLIFTRSSPSVWMAYFSSDDERIINYMSHKHTFVESHETLAKISLHITEVFRRNTRKNPCMNGEKPAICVTNCLEEEIYSRIKTKCRLPFMKESATYPPCRTWTEYLDIKKASAEVLESFDKKECNCPRNCKEIIYSLEDSNIVSMPTNFIELKLHIPENRIAVIQEETAYGFVRLLSDLGGLLGLFFGIGLIQILELVTARISKLCK